MNIFEYKNKKPNKFYVILNDKGEYLHYTENGNKYYYDKDNSHALITFQDLKLAEKFCVEHNSSVMNNCDDWFIEQITVEVKSGIVL